MKCKNCGAELHQDANFCMMCGAKVEKETICASCGTKLPENAAFCFNCGAKQGKAEDDFKYDYYVKDRDSFERAKYDINLDNIASIKVEEGVRVCPCFYNMKKLKRVSLPSTLETIGHQDFCVTGIESIEIPDSVTEIGSHAFEYSQQLETVKMSRNIQKIDAYAFFGCIKLRTIEYRGSYYTENDFMELMRSEGKVFYF